MDVLRVLKLAMKLTSPYLCFYLYRRVQVHTKKNTCGHSWLNRAGTVQKQSGWKGLGICMLFGICMYIYAVGKTSTLSDLQIKCINS